MLLTSIDPFVQEFDRQFDRLTRQALGWGQNDTRGAMPLDGVRRKDDVLLKFDLPGADPDSVEVTVDRGVLSVSARREEEYGQDDRLFVRERPMGAFTRRVYLSEHLDSEKIDAAYSNGVLAVRIPVIEKAKPRKVEIHKADEVKSIKA
ncbi:Hsp20/alpha crystallin family protein [Streptosporangium roseum]|uniref:Molecular chaperone (Small heat shock protein)-like protein n=1 Tax=Streptosporangium roseum (strain ATCC 12428 / DSM 43021 / JCM 3005 / KCTC 9067 / NCIMB 10171 / NRRL 2505 / NI 9100) TaxID=479432 RepID=D2BD46_STRRD|nr:Hsp20/alpha crystallin family protein [Streptosporangium roseum]ACZ84287.1 Molecular chaperone (small heat shock protein)- like protein [Streptosporangium roseum DSM 43021]